VADALTFAAMLGAFVALLTALASAADAWERLH